MIRVLLSKSTCLIMKFANRVIVSANRKCTWNSREIRTWKRVVLMGKRLKIIYIKILWGGKYNKYIIKFVLWDCFLDIFAVEAYTASWIEIAWWWLGIGSNRVEAYTASWIEIPSCRRFISCRCVEAYTASWIEIEKYNAIEQIQKVEAYTASWIEIILSACVLTVSPVEAYTASWIEIVPPLHPSAPLPSKPIRLRGLKYIEYFPVFP